MVWEESVFPFAVSPLKLSNLCIFITANHDIYSIHFETNALAEPICSKILPTLASLFQQKISMAAYTAQPEEDQLIKREATNQSDQNTMNVFTASLRHLSRNHTFLVQQFIL